MLTKNKGGQMMSKRRKKEDDLNYYYVVCRSVVPCKGKVDIETVYISNSLILAWQKFKNKYRSLKRNKKLKLKWKTC